MSVSAVAFESEQPRRGLYLAVDNIAELDPVARANYELYREMVKGKTIGSLVTSESAQLDITDGAIVTTRTSIEYVPHDYLYGSADSVTPVQYSTSEFRG